jgi:outer membrane protein
MKKLLASLIILGFAGMASSAHAQMKVGTVDMTKIFNSYYKTKEAESRINDARNAAKQELDERLDNYKKNVDQINKLNDEMGKSELSKEKKDDVSKRRDDIIAETKNLEREIGEFRQSREKQLQDQAMRMRNGIVEEITKLVQDKVKSENYDLVIDRSGSSLNGVPVIIFARENMDFSDELITALNKNKPKDTGAAKPTAEKPAGTPKK